MIEYTVVLTAAGLHAVWNAILKSGDDRTASLIIIRSTGIIAGAFLVSLNPLIHAQAFVWLGGAVSIHLLYYFFLLRAYGAGDFSQVYPIARGTAPVLVTFGAVLFADEHLSTQAYLGIGLVAAGVILLALSSKVRLTKQALGYSLSTAACIAGYTFCGGSGIRQSGSLWSFIGLLEISTGSIVLLYGLLAHRQPLREHLTQRGLVTVLAGVLSVAGFGAALWAMTKAPLGPVAALRETGIVFAAVIGALFLGEKRGLRKIASSCVVLAGIFLILSAAE